MNFSSIQEITILFGINNSESYSEILSELKEKRNKIHPDRTGGNFISKMEETEFLNLNDAIEWINSNSQLIPLNQITDLIKAIKGSEKENSNKSEIEEKKNNLSKALDSNKELISKRLQFPKIAVSVVAGIISFLWLFPKQIMEHPILGRLVDIKGLQFQVFWLFSLISAVYLWVYSYIKDLKQQHLTKTIETDLFQYEIFRSFLLYNNEEKLFRKSMLDNFLISRLNTRKKRSIEMLFVFYTLGLYGIKSKIDIDIAENLSSLIIKKNLERGVISKVNHLSFEDEYQINI